MHQNFQPCQILSSFGVSVLQLSTVPLYNNPTILLRFLIAVQIPEVTKSGWLASSRSVFWTATSSCRWDWSAGSS